mmetsp:Transcript_2437/g.3351  ORF Transcript_2437/g.3351 Transcript_2437/m.3351 type:complete len:116 (-) Transcript_2437:265-612(-)
MVSSMMGGPKPLRNWQFSSKLTGCTRFASGCTRLGSSVAPHPFFYFACAVSAADAFRCFLLSFSLALASRLDLAPAPCLGVLACCTLAPCKTWSRLSCANCITLFAKSTFWLDIT